MHELITKELFCTKLDACGHLAHYHYFPFYSLPHCPQEQKKNKKKFQVGCVGWVSQNWLESSKGAVLHTAPGPPHCLLFSCVRRCLAKVLSGPASLHSCVCFATQTMVSSSNEICNRRVARAVRRGGHVDSQGLTCVDDDDHTCVRSATRELSRELQFIGICARSLFTLVAGGSGLKHLRGKIPTDPWTQNNFMQSFSEKKWLRPIISMQIIDLLE